MQCSKSKEVGHWCSVVKKSQTTEFRGQLSVLRKGDQEEMAEPNSSYYEAHCYKSDTQMRAKAEGLQRPVTKMRCHSDRVLVKGALAVGNAGACQSLGEHSYFQCNTNKQALPW